uniref:hypothetical protein n=1 Tax=Flavobacterium sp. TaxID=239 RepID=UPI002635A043
GLYGADQNGLLIFITDVTGGNILSQRINVDTNGYYYFDGPSNIWKKVCATSWKIIGTIQQASLNTQSIYQNADVGIGNFSATAPTEKLDVNGNMRLRNMPDGKLRADYPYTIVAKEDGTLGTSRGHYRGWRVATSNVQAVMSDDDDVLTIYTARFSTSAWEISLPSNPKPGRVVTIRNDGSYSGTYSIATPGVIPPGYLPTNFRNDVAEASDGFGLIYVSDYKTTIKAQTVLKLVWTGRSGDHALGWVQIGGDNQMP